MSACTRQRRPESPARFALATFARMQLLNHHHPSPLWLPRFCWWSPFRPLPGLAGLWSAMAIAPPDVRPPRPLEPPAPLCWSLDAAGRAWDLSGSSRSAWSRGEAAAWACCGFHIWPRWNAVNVGMLRQSSTGRRPSWTLTKGVVPGAFFGLTDPYVIVRTAPHSCAVSGFGVEFVASVRAVQHWVSRWRRGLRRLRRENARVVLAHKLPGLPALVQHVQSFL